MNCMNQLRHFGSVEVPVDRKLRSGSQLDLGPSIRGRKSPNLVEKVEISVKTLLFSRMNLPATTVR